MLKLDNVETKKIAKLVNNTEFRPFFVWLTDTFAYKKDMLVSAESNFEHLQGECRMLRQLLNAISQLKV